MKPQRRLSWDSQIQLWLDVITMIQRISSSISRSKQKIQKPKILLARFVERTKEPKLAVVVAKLTIAQQNARKNIGLNIKLYARNEVEIRKRRIWK